MTLTDSQEQALQTLLAARSTGLGQRAMPVPTNGIISLTELAHAWLGLSPDTLDHWKTEIADLEHQLEANLLGWFQRDPFTSGWQFLLVSAAAFHAAEQGKNPRIKTFVDSFYFISTCASVGYADIFPVTQKGKAIASLVMTLGPASAARVLDLPGK